MNDEFSDGGVMFIWFGYEFYGIFYVFLFVVCYDVGIYVWRYNRFIGDFYFDYCGFCYIRNVRSVRDNRIGFESISDGLKDVRKYFYYNFEFCLLCW